MLDSEGGSITSMSSRHSSASANPLSEKMMSLNLPGAGAPKLSSLRGLDSVEPNENTIPLLSTSSLLQPRPIIRNKGREPLLCIKKFKTDVSSYVIYSFAFLLPFRDNP